MCPHNPSGERDQEAGGPARLGGRAGERKLEHLRLLEGKRERWKGQGEGHPMSHNTNNLGNLLNIEFSVLKTVLLIPSLIVPPKLPGLCSGISITLENKTGLVLSSCKHVVPQISSFTFREMVIG